MYIYIYIYIYVGVCVCVDPLWPSGYDIWLPTVSSQVRISARSPK